MSGCCDTIVTKFEFPVSALFPFAENGNGHDVRSIVAVIDRKRKW